jgi:hypothetical protein
MRMKEEVKKAIAPGLHQDGGGGQNEETQTGNGSKNLF